MKRIHIGIQVDAPQAAMWEVFFTTGIDASGGYGCADLPDV